MGPYFAREVQIFLLEATTVRYYCSLKRLAETFPFNLDDYFTHGQNTDLVEQIHSKQIAGLSAARESNRAAGERPSIAQEEANNALPYPSSMPSRTSICRERPEEEPSALSAGGDPEPDQNKRSQRGRC